VLLAIAGAIYRRREWHQRLVIYALFLGFPAVSAVFWAHTSHRSHLDVYLLCSRLWGSERLRSLVDTLGARVVRTPDALGIALVRKATALIGGTSVTSPREVLSEGRD
jgi:hypothetical protein